jgi:hypothetical protein
VRYPTFVVELLLIRELGSQKEVFTVRPQKLHKKITTLNCIDTRGALTGEG